jgi:putative ABC transport system permease protein
MFKNFLKTAYRNLYRHKGFSFINIAGLTLGLTACLSIGLFIWDENQYDILIPEGERIYRLYDVRTTDEETSTIARTPPMSATALQQQFPEVEKTVRIYDLQSKLLFQQGDKKIYEEKGIAAEPAFFDFFQVPFKYGSAEKALNDPKSIVLTQELAEKYFGKENPVGRQILMEQEPYQVKGVLQTSFLKFHLPLSFIIPLEALQLPKERMQSWQWHQFYTYVKLKKGIEVKDLQSKFQDLIRHKVNPITKEDGSTYLPFFQPLKEIHLYSSNFKYDIAERGNIIYVKALTIIAAFILLIACLNFINLATAKSIQRAKEVGVRKSIGANRKQLMLQFTGETILLSFISVILSSIATGLLLPSLNHFTDKHISLEIFLNPSFLLLLLLLTLAVGVAAGFYPALVLSRYMPVKVLKGGLVNDVSNGKIPWLRHSLVVVQFALSALLTVSAIVVFRQVNYLHNKNLGFSREEIMFFPMRGDNLTENYESFKNQLLQSSGVLNVSIGYGFPGDLFATDDIIVPKGGQQKKFSVIQLLVDHDYIKTLGMKIIAGRDFSKDIKTDKDAAFIINESAVKELGYGTPEKAIGQPLVWEVWDSQTPDSLKKGQIIGVVNNFHLKSLYDKVSATVLQIYPQAYWKVAVKMKTADIQNTIGNVKNVWSRFSPEYPIEYNFMDENFEQMYKSEDKLKTLLSLFTCIAIFVGCLGLFGLAAFTAQRRTKEIGIRKVLGASVKGIVLLLSKDFLKLVLVALVIASPVAWYFMNEWLQDFAYRVSIDVSVFALAAFLSISIALITVSFQAVRSAIANPVKSLRIE